MAQALAALVPSEEPARTPFLSARQHEAMVEVVQASSAWDPLNAALNALSALAGPLLVVAAILTLVQLAQGPTWLRAALLVTAGVNAVHALWSVAWYLLLWGPWMGYLQTALPASARSDLSGEATEAIMATSLAIVVGLSAGWFLLKAGFLVLGARMLRDPEPPQIPAGPPSTDLTWAE
jgi:hypothetical protein